jgi:hypothetical protein
MRSVATAIADLLPVKAAEAIRKITGDRELTTVDEHMQPVVNPELPEIARALPADTAYQITRAAARLGFIDYSDVLAEVANAVTRKAARPKGFPHGAAPRLAGSSFPHPPLTIRDDGEPAMARKGRPGNRLKLGRLDACHLPDRIPANGPGLRIVMKACSSTTRCSRRTPILCGPLTRVTNARLRPDRDVLRGGAASAGEPVPAK